MHYLKSSARRSPARERWVESMSLRARDKAQPSARYEQRRLEVLRAAARTFNRRSFRSATLDDVADELGVTKPAIYYYAKSKDQLVSACADIALATLRQALAETSELSPSERLRRFFTRYAEVICEDFGRCLVLTEPRDLGPQARKGNIAGRRALSVGVREIVRAGVADGSYRPCDDLALASAMFDAFNGLARWFNPKGATPLPDMIETYLAFFEAGVARSPTAKPARPSPRARR